MQLPHSFLGNCFESYALLNTHTLRGHLKRCLPSKLQPVVKRRYSTANSSPAFALPLLITTLLITALCAAPNNAHARQAFPLSEHNSEKYLEKQRALFKEAESLIAKGKLISLGPVLEQLEDYPLYPYLEFKLIQRHSNNVDDQTVDDFIERNKGHFLERWARTSRLHHLHRKKRAAQFIALYNPKEANSSLKCKYVDMLNLQGANKKAEHEAAQIWMTGRSLPKTCDKTLDRFIETTRYLDDALIGRAMLALDNGETGFARYLLKKQGAPKEVLSLLSRPQKLPELIDKLEPSPYREQLIYISFKRLAKQDYMIADSLWQQYQKTIAFTKEERADLREKIARQMLAAQDESVEDWLEIQDPNAEDQYLLEWRVRLAIKRLDWSKTEQLIQRMTPETFKDVRWQYWLARAEIELYTQDNTPPSSSIVALETIAQDRGYYSFLAAELLGQDYYFGDQPLHDPELAAQLELELHIQRARELYLMKHRYWAAMEWNVAMRELSVHQRGVAAEIAHKWGWHHRAIVEAGRSDKLDDLEVRFPMPFKSEFERSAKAEKIDQEWLYAVARQESAFNERARSSAGALGLLQMLPGTAQLVARETGRSIRTKQLYQPEYSVRFGASYLRQLSDEFNGNRILATASYNAGPNRIKRVLENQGSALPFDIWLENLPYTETRHYVQNVLAYSVIYQRRMGLKPSGMISANERIISLENGIKTAATR